MVTWSTDLSLYYLYYLSGPIAPGDTERLKVLVAGGRPHQPLMLELDSPGGDVYEAMRLGRFLRDKRASAAVSFFQSGPHASKEPHTCASACVLVLAGASTRSVGGSYPGGRVLVHRPYLNVAPSPNLIEGSWRQMSKDLRAYLSDMNVPVAFADLMMSTPPEQAHLLTRDELDRFLPGTDPVYEEEVTAALAEMVGVTSSEYRQRLLESQSVCGSIEYPNCPNPTPECSTSPPECSTSPPTAASHEACVASHKACQASLEACNRRTAEWSEQRQERWDCQRAFIARVPAPGTRDRAGLAREWRLVASSCPPLYSKGWEPCRDRVLHEQR